MDPAILIKLEHNNDIFHILKDRALARSSSWRDDKFLIRGLWQTDLVFQPSIDERKIDYTFILAQTFSQGCCYCDSRVVLERALVGRDAREVISEINCINIALLDSIYGSLDTNPEEIVRIEGNSIEKTNQRNLIVVEELERLIGSGVNTPHDVRVVNVGAVDGLIRRLVQKGYSVFATDFDEGIIGTSLHGIRIDPGTMTPKHVGTCDFAIITGMTLSTSTLDEIVDIAKRHDTRLIMFAETGANMGEEYCNTIGIDTVISELFPFYIYQGVSTIKIYRKS